jgi:hypothetical protein
MMTLNIIEEAFNTQYAYLYTLQMMVGGERLNILLEDEQNHVIGVRTYQLPPKERDAWGEIQRAITSDTMLRQNFRMVKISYAHERFVLMPAMLFDMQKASEYLKAVTNIDEEAENVGVDYIRELDIYCIYPKPTAFEAYTEDFFPRQSTKFWLSGLLAGYTKLNTADSKKEVFVNVLNRHLAIVVMEKGKLLFCNVFEYSIVKEFLYYVLLVFEALKLSPERVPVRLSGEIVSESDIYRELYKYIRRVEFVGRPSHYRYGTQTEQLPGNFLYDLYNIKLCE